MSVMSRVFKSSLFAVGLLSGSLSLSWARTVEPLTGALSVGINEISISKPPTGTRSIIVSNPIFADVQLAANGQLVIIGRGHGATNLLFQDAEGKILQESRVVVTSALDKSRETLTVNMAGSRKTYFCVDTCRETWGAEDDPANVDQFVNSVRKSGASGQPAK